MKVSAKYNRAGKAMEVTITPPEKVQPTKRHWIMNVDVSGSMDCPAGRSAAECDGLTRLDLVKHSLKTVVAGLGDQDWVSIVEFHSSAELIVKELQMTEANRQAVIDKISVMCTKGSTNIIDSFEQSIKAMAKSNQEKQQIMMLLTDGQPDGTPEETIDFFKKQFSAHPKRFNLHCFGYGYDLNTDLMTKLSTIGLGGYYYVPDQSMVGTCFVNFAANIACLYRSWAEVSCGKAEPAHVNGLYFGQPYTLLLRDAEEGQVAVKTVDGTATADPVAVEPAEIRKTTARQLAVDAIQLGIDQFQAAFVEPLKQQLEALNQPEDEFISALLSDLVSDDANKGQVAKAVSKEEWYASWGKNHLVAFQRALQLQIATNFKDQAVQFFGGADFKLFQEKFEALFCKLPPPQPSIQNYDDQTGGQGAPYQAASMTTYMNRCGGCFAGHCAVPLQGGASVRADELEKGDVLENGAVVECVVQTLVDGELELCELGALLITPWHPVCVNGKWEFPAHLAQPRLCSVDAVYNVVLRSVHSLTVGGVQAIALGHNMAGDVVGHAYFGSQAVVDDLKQMAGYQQGRVLVDGRKCRVSADERVCGLLAVSE